MKTSRAPFGYHGCYLRVDVTRGSAERVPLTDTVLRQFLGGSGLGAWLLLDESQATCHRLLRTHREQLDALATRLLEREVLSGDELKSLLGSELTLSTQSA